MVGVIPSTVLFFLISGFIISTDFSGRTSCGSCESTICSGMGFSGTIISSVVVTCSGITSSVLSIVSSIICHRRFCSNNTIGSYRLFSSCSLHNHS